VAAKIYFPRVKEAREALASHALELLETHKKLILEAAMAGNYEAALKASQWLLEHMPREEGTAIIDESAAKPKMVAEGPKGPSIQIGVVLGGMNEKKQLADKVKEIVDVPATKVEPE